MLLVPELSEMKEEQQVLSIKDQLLIMKNLHRQEDFSFTVVKENRNNPLPETKIVLNYYLIIMSETLTTVPKRHSSWIPKMNLNDKKKLQWPFFPYSLKLTFPNSTLLISSEQAKLGVKCTPLQVSVDAPDHFFLVYIVPILTLIGIYMCYSGYLNSGVLVLAMKHRTVSPVWPTRSASKMLILQKKHINCSEQEQFRGKHMTLFYTVTADLQVHGPSPVTARHFTPFTWFLRKGQKPCLP